MQFDFLRQRFDLDISGSVEVMVKDGGGVKWKKYRYSHNFIPQKLRIVMEIPVESIGIYNFTVQVINNGT